MQFEWIDFYTEFATALLSFKSNRKALIEKIKKVYADIGIKLPKLESGNEIIDIDPFTVFGLFNKGISDSKRITILNGISAEFEIKSAVPHEFDGIPLLNNLSATFYGFLEDRKENDIENIWQLFSAAIVLSGANTAENRSVFSKWYDIVSEQFCIGWKITMGLFWIRPHTYLNLDATNRGFLENLNCVPADFAEKMKSKLKKMPSAEEYLSIIDDCRKVMARGEYKFKSFPELSYCAWISPDNKHDSDSEKNSETSKASFLRWFKPLIQALCDLGGSATPAEARKKIIENEELTEEEISVTRGKNNVNKFENEVAFARSYLVRAGYIDNSIHGVWTLTDAGKTVEMTEELASDIFKKSVSENLNNLNNIASSVDKDVRPTHYWLYAPGDGAEMWDEFYKNGIMAIGWSELGDLRVYTSKAEITAKMKEVYDPNGSFRNSAYANWQFANDIKAGDIIFVKKGRNKLVGRGIVRSDYEFDDSRDDKYKHQRTVEWTHNGEWDYPGLTIKTLTDITYYTEYVDKMNALFADESAEDEEEDTKSYPTYSAEDFLSEVYMSEVDYERLVGVLKNKKNVILQGAPGVGKTFAAKRLAYSIMGVIDIERVMMVQFHQSYSYEDFIMGYRPTDTGFELKKGAFYNFCKKAEEDTDNDYFFIIDEINRGNISRIFGELFMLIESDKRGMELRLLYSDEKFSVPKNVHIIGMMNTADRSLAMLDYALRRRFAFVELKPGFATDGFCEYRMRLDNEKFNSLIHCVENLNSAIAADESLGEGFCIGHSYFCNLEGKDITDSRLSEIVEFELIPLLKEYWFDEPSKVRDWSEKLRSAVK